MLKPDYTNRFKKDLKIIQKRNYNVDLLKEVIKKLCNQEILDEKYRDHSLSGNMKSFRECHILPDWLLIYQIVNGIIVFDRTGTHSDLFE